MDMVNYKFIKNKNIKVDGNMESFYMVIIIKKIIIKLFN